MIACKLGTSPRVRGKRVYADGSAGRTGYIPACAGEAPRAARRARREKVHPRVCGGSAFKTLVDLVDGGTSPRVRGKRRRAEQPDGVRGYIPACAGGSLAKGDHPEHGPGTSPRVRGKRRCARCHTRIVRYIPACAGEACRHRHGPANWTVHPRVCGGSRVAGRADARAAGTSPRVRGKRDGPQARLLDAGYIPACAGEAQRISVDGGRYQVHPRVCGGSRAPSTASLPDSGTSPRVRGKRRRVAERKPVLGYIPACAGEARFFFDPSERTRVHPRVCGGKP